MIAVEKGKAWDQSAVGVGVRSHPPDLQRLYPRPCALPPSLRFPLSGLSATTGLLTARWRRGGEAAIRENPVVLPGETLTPGQPSRLTTPARMAQRTSPA